jgi:predicted nucleic acid-binding protein
MKMTDRRLYDTRFFVEYFFSEDKELLKKLKQELRSVKERMVSVLTIHEIYRINTKREGREVALLRSSAIRSDFTVVDVDYEAAVISAELRTHHQMPMADSIIAASAQICRCPLVSDDAHFKEVAGLTTRWYD